MALFRKKKGDNAKIENDVLDFSDYYNANNTSNNVNNNMNNYSNQNVSNVYSNMNNYYNQNNYGNNSFGMPHNIYNFNNQLNYPSKKSMSFETTNEEGHNKTVKIVVLIILIIIFLLLVYILLWGIPFISY